MATIQEKVSYLKGLCDGLDIDAQTKEGKLLKAIIEVLDEVAENVENLYAAQDEMSENLEDLTDELADLEDAVFVDEDECDEDECDGDCAHCDDDCCDFREDEEEMEDDEDEAASYIEFNCQNCGNRILYDVDSFDIESNHVCPKCGTPIFTDVEDDGEEED